MAIQSLTVRGIDVSYVPAYGEFVIKNSLLLPFERQLIEESDNTQSYFETNLSPNGQTLQELFVSRLTTVEVIESEILTRLNGSGNITIKNVDIPNSGFEFDVMPQYDSLNISITLYDTNGDILTEDTGIIQFYGRTTLSEYFTPIQNGMFYLTDPESVGLASVPIERIRMNHDMDYTNLARVKITVRQYHG